MFRGWNGRRGQCCAALAAAMLQLPPQPCVRSAATPSALNPTPPHPTPTLQVPERKTDAALRLPISGIYKIKGVGDVLAGRVEQGIVKPGDEVIFMPTHTAANKCEGKVSRQGQWVGEAVAVGRCGGLGGRLRKPCTLYPVRFTALPPPTPSHTLPPPPAINRCSLWRCTTSAWTRPAPATTWA